MKKSFIIHHTGGSNKKPLADTAHHTFSMVNSYHKERFKKFKSKLGYYIGYHYYIEKSGVVTQGRAVNEVGAHTYGYNQHIGVCLAGNFDRDIETANSHPTKKQLESLRELYNDLVKRNIIEENKRGIWFHRDIANKTCPGLNMNKQMIVNYLLNNNNIKILNIELFYPSSISKKEEKGIKQAMENVKELIQENTSSSLILNFNLKLIPLKPINIYWQGNTIKRSWFDINILTKTNNNTDIVMLMLPKEYWLSRKYLGYVHADKRHGVSIGAMKVQVDATRTKNGELMDRDYNSTILLHEITHILYAMNNKPFLKDKEKQKQRLPNIDNTHYFDYYVDDKDLRFPLFWEIETNRLNTKPNNLLYMSLSEPTTSLNLFSDIAKFPEIFILFR